MKCLYKGGGLFDGTEFTPSGRALLTEDQRVIAVAPDAEFDGFQDGEVIDTSGATVMPGMIDCHVHLVLGGEADPGTASEKLLPGQITMRALQRAQSNLAGGITAVRDCGGKDYLEFAVRDVCNTGQLLGPSIRAAGRMICMTGGHGSRVGRVADGIDEVVKAVREQIHAGSDLVKIMATGGVMTPGVNPEDAHYSPEEMAAGIKEANRFHRKTASHAQGAEGVLNAVRGGVDSVEHGIFLNDTCVEEMLAAGTYLVPTLSALRNILDNHQAGIPDYVVEKSQRISEHHRRSIKMYYDAGGRIAMGTDAGTPFNLHGNNAHELGYMVDIGISPLDALKISTANAADLIGLEGEGHLQTGGFADLLVVNGNPVADIRMASEPANHRFVVKRGVLVGEQTRLQGFAARPAYAAF